VTIVRTGSSLAGNVSVAYATASGTARPGDDYTATSGTVTFNVYRSGTRLTSSPISLTNYTDNGASAGASYTVRAVINVTACWSRNQ